MFCDSCSKYIRPEYIYILGRFQVIGKQVEPCFIREFRPYFLHIVGAQEGAEFAFYIFTRVKAVLCSQQIIRYNYIPCRDGRNEQGKIVHRFIVKTKRQQHVSRSKEIRYPGRCISAGCRFRISQSFGKLGTQV